MIDPVWVQEFSKIGIDCSAFPLSVIKRQDWANECKAKNVYPGEEFISPEIKKIPGIYIIVKGIVGVGDFKTILGKKYLIEELCLTPFSFLLEAEAGMKFDGKDYPSVLPPQRRAWSSSQCLSRLIAYAKSKGVYDKISGFLVEKHLEIKFSEEVKLLKIPLEYVNRFLKVKKLADFMLRDVFRKSKKYLLWPEGADLAKTLALRIKALYWHCIINKLDVEGKVYILGKERLDAIIRLPIGHTRPYKKIGSKQSILEHAKKTLTEDGFKIENVSVEELPKQIKEIYDSIYKGRSGKSLPYKIERS